MRFDTPEGSLDVAVKALHIAGWTGRDAAAVQHHIEELAALGVAPPSQVPLFYRGSASLVMQAPQIEVLGKTSSGEVEPLIIHHEGVLWLGLGSDHTDRELESVSVAMSKQACPKPVAGTLWRFDAVETHLDSLSLRCEIEEDGDWVLYQEGRLGAIRPLRELINASGLGPGDAMLCGTLGAIGGVRPAEKYRMAIIDDRLSRRIDLEYQVRTLPVIA